MVFAMQFASLIFGRAKYDIQNRIVKLSAAIQRKTKEINRLDKQLASEKRSAINAAKMKHNSIFSSSVLMNSLAGDYKNLFNADGSYNYKYLETEAGKGDLAMFQQQYATRQQVGQNTLGQTLAQIEDYFEEQRTMFIEPLQDEEADLKAEKETLTMQLETAKGSEQQAKQMAQDNIKGLFGN